MFGGLEEMLEAALFVYTKAELFLCTMWAKAVLLLLSLVSSCMFR